MDDTLFSGKKGGDGSASNTKHVEDWTYSSVFLPHREYKTKKERQYFEKGVKMKKLLIVVIILISL
ncbi:hypothetical protein IBX73_06995 [candidate division WOR-3 bacterium]|nr:hypothetical protein [candidate division WOR-3 bacterium]